MNQYGGVQKWRVPRPIAGWFISRKIQLTWMIWGYPPFVEPPIWSYFSLVNDDNLLRTMNYLHFIVVSTCLQHQT